MDVTLARSGDHAKQCKLPVCVSVLGGSAEVWQARMMLVCMDPCLNLHTHWCTDAEFDTKTHTHTHTHTQTHTHTHTHTDRHNDTRTRTHATSADAVVEPRAVVIIHVHTPTAVSTMVAPERLLRHADAAHPHSQGPARALLFLFPRTALRPCHRQRARA